MGIYFGGQEYDMVYIGGSDAEKLIIGGTAYHEEEMGPPPTPMHPGSVVPTGVRRNNSRVRSMSAVLTDLNGVTAITSVTFRITRTDRSVRFTHTEYSVDTTLPANAVTVTAINEPGNFRAGANNLLNVEITYTDATGSHTVSGEARFTTQ